MAWPPQSPDLNPINMVRDESDRRVKEKQPTSAQHMWELLQECWKSIPGVAGWENDKSVQSCHQGKGWLLFSILLVSMGYFIVLMSSLLFCNVVSWKFPVFTKSWEQTTHKSELSQSPSLSIWAPSQPGDSQINSVSINDFSESPLHIATEILYSKDTHSQTALAINYRSVWSPKLCSFLKLRTIKKILISTGIYQLHLFELVTCIKDTCPYTQSNRLQPLHNGQDQRAV